VTTKVLDEWAEWLLRRRHGGDAELLRRQLEYLAPVRDRVLDNAEVAAGDVVLDVGAGDGLIAFGALERVGPSGHVIFNDVSQDLLDHSRSLAESAGVLDRCEFVRASAEDLSVLGDGQVSVVTTRSVLIYVLHKRRAIGEFHRVLKPRGRLSIFEPINRFGHERSFATAFYGLDLAPVADIWRKIRALYERLQPETDPMLDFDERDLFSFVEDSGFREVRMEYRADVAAPREELTWERLIRGAGNPKIPSLEEAMADVLTAQEGERLAAYIRPLLQKGTATTRSATVYLWAKKAAVP